ncbi:MAG: SUMF1/EgtB/PvdO family nonheme iron enzyme [Gallionella sp.]|nr:SUMF1/EgtB/PvdO family nonheme iron enzyme [Gallionella sp.]
MSLRSLSLHFCVGMAFLAWLVIAPIGLALAATENFPPGYSFSDCSACPKMIVVPAGRFVLGTTDSVQPLVIDKAFAIGKYEVTFDEWDACVAAGGCGGYRPSDEGWGRGRHPVMNLSWQDANLYVQWLSKKTGRHYRLPSEVEWEYAARAGLSPQHLRGDVPGSNSANCDNCVGQWGNLQTAPVGRLEANVFGLFDTHGNIWEWVDDCDDCECTTRILRGAALGNGGVISRASRRLRHSDSDRNGHAGLRVAMSLTSDTQAAMPNPPEETRMVGSLIPKKCGKPSESKAESECKPVREVYRMEVSDNPIVIDGAFFDTDSAALKPEGKEKLDGVAEFAEKYREANLNVIGHTDSRGTEARNRKLSAARAVSVKNYLVVKGVAENRITTSGVASTQPLDTNETKEGRAKNRRVEIHSTVRVETKVRVE